MISTERARRGKIDNWQAENKFQNENVPQTSQRDWHIWPQRSCKFLKILIFIDN